MSMPSAPKAAKIWRWLQENPGSTSLQVQQAMGMPRKNAAAILSEMEREGNVQAERIFSETARRHVRTYRAVEATCQ